MALTFGEIWENSIIPASKVHDGMGIQENMSKMATATVDSPKVSKILSETTTLSSTFTPNMWIYEGPFDLIIGDEVLWIMEILVTTILCGLISTAGLVANIFNVIVFRRQGALTSSSNISLLALALSDIGSLVPLVCNSINYALHFWGNSSPFLTPKDFTEIFVLWPHIMFIQISSWITVYIALERCMCVVFPLKVKMLFSAKRSLVVVSTIAVLAACSFIPIYMTTDTEELYDTHTNATKLIFSLNEDLFEVVEVSNVIQSIVLRILSVAIVFVCTQITVHYVRLSTAWRRRIASGSSFVSSASAPITTVTTTSTITNTDTNSSGDSPTLNPPATAATADAAVTTTTTTTPSNTNIKERRVIKVITMISTIFMVCNTPEILSIFTLITMESVHGISPWDNLIHFLMHIQFFFESINASINIFVYYGMSTRYKQEFRAMFGKK